MKIKFFNFVLYKFIAVLRPYKSSLVDPELPIKVWYFVVLSASQALRLVTIADIKVFYTQAEYLY